MAELKQLERDLGYVRDVVHRSERGSGPAAIYLFWAAVVLVGFPLGDWAPRHTGTFWMIVGPAGWLISAFLGYRHARSTGQYDSREGRRHGLHWGVMLAIIFMAVLLPARGFATWDVLGPLVLLIVAMSYVLAAIHLDRLLLWPGLMMVAGYGLLIVGVGYTWTIVGVLVSAGLVVSSFVGGRSRVTQQV
jgi:hypothetical protein